MNYNMIRPFSVAIKSRLYAHRNALLAAIATTLLMTISATAHAAADDIIKEANRLYQQGKFTEALTKVNVALQQQPKDAQSRFLKGLIQTEQKKTQDAIQTFTALTEDFPELPEPYNNLAVLYAGQGNYDKAKAALELAIHTHPSYATAHENLGDIYAQLARRAYDKALQLDKTNATALSKLTLVKEMFSAPKAVQVATVQPAVQAPPTTAAVKPDTTKAPATTPAVTQAASVTPTTTPTKPATATSATEDGVKAAVQAWAKAWSARDVPAYLGFYAATFETPDGLSRGAWESQRRERISRQSKISVDVTIRSVKIKGNEATAVFRQKYRADTVNSDNTKTLKLVRAGDKWLIQSEKSGG